MYSPQDYQEKGSFEILLEIWKHLTKKRRIQLLAFTLLNILSSFSESLSIALTLPLISVVIDPNQIWNVLWIQKFFLSIGISSPENILTPVTLIFIFASLISTFVKLSILKANNFFAAAIGNDLSCLAYSRTLNRAYESHIESNSSEIISAATNYIDFTVYSIYSFLNLLSNISFVITIEITLFLFNWLVAFFSLIIFGSAYYLISYRAKIIMYKNGKVVAQKIKERIKSIQEGMGSIREVLLGSKQKVFVDNYSKLDLIYRKKLASNKFITFAPKYIIENIGFIFIAILAYIFSKEGNAGQILPVLGTFAVAAQKLLPSMQQCYNSVGAIRSNKGSIMEVLKMLDQNNFAPVPKNLKPLNFKQKIELSNIYFKYLNSDEYILKDINLIINKGERIGIIGKTGSGKTTLTDILMGLLVPNKGSIFIDDKKLYGQYNPEQIYRWRLAISHVPQNIFLSDNSIAENIAFGVSLERIDFKKLKHAAKRAQLHSFIESNKDKYFTKIGENGLKLSGGQRQRIGIARSLYHDSQLIFFDEATSALDNKTESAVMQSLNDLDKNLTIVIVAHRMSTIENCDRVLKIENSRIIEIG